MGYWGLPTSSIDFCEPNYAISWYVAEFFSTLSNVPVILLSASAMRRVFGTELQTRSVCLGYFVPIIVFGGSFCFHATLTYFGQLLDELPMIYGVLYFHWLLDASKTWLCVLAGAVITTAMLALRESPLPLQLSYGMLVIGLVVRGALTLSTDSVLRSSGVLQVAASVYAVGFVCWALDQAFCPLVKGMYLHAYWHLFSGAGTFLFLQFSQAHHMRQQRKKFLHAQHCGLPFVIQSGKGK